MPEVFNACESVCGLFCLGLCVRKKFKAPSNNDARGKKEKKLKGPSDNGVRRKRKKFKASSDNGVRGKRKKNSKLQVTMVQEGKENCVMKVFMRMEGFHKTNEQIVLST